MKVNIWHRVLPNIDAIGDVHAEQMVDILHEFNSKNTIKTIPINNTNANTGCEGGMVANLEKKCLIFSQSVPICTIMNYLSEHFFKNIDCCANSPTAFSGPLRKICSKDFHDLPQISFYTISSHVDSILKIDEIYNLSCDQRPLNVYAISISRGKVDSRYASRKMCPLNLAR